jgi:hypothetical protein
VVQSNTDGSHHPEDIQEGFSLFDHFYHPDHYIGCPTECQSADIAN